MSSKLILFIIIIGVCSSGFLDLFYYTWTITPNDIDREIQVWKDRKSGKLKQFWDFLAINYDADQIINVLEYAKKLKNKSVLITCKNLFWKAEVIYTNK